MQLNQHCFVHQTPAAVLVTRNRGPGSLTQQLESQLEQFGNTTAARRGLRPRRNSLTMEPATPPIKVSIEFRWQWKGVPMNWSRGFQTIPIARCSCGFTEVPPPRHAISQLFDRRIDGRHGRDPAQSKNMHLCENCSTRRSPATAHARQHPPGGQHPVLHPDRGRYSDIVPATAGGASAQPAPLP